MAYTVTNDLRSLDCHDAVLTDAVWQDSRITLTFHQAVVIGHSCPELENRIPCPMNPGEDRYAAPELTVQLDGVRQLSVLRGGCWKNDVQVYPPRTLTPAELPGFFAMVPRRGFVNHVYDMTWGEDGVLTLSFWLDADVNYYELSCVPGSVAARWDDYGAIAWYVDHYRQKQAARRQPPVYGAIDCGSLRGYTMLRDLVPALADTFTRYNWLVTDCYCSKDNAVAEADRREGYCWLTGRELVEFAERDDSQFIGAVFSGFPERVTLEQVLAHPLPVWESPSFWYEPLTLQHPLSQVELVPWDSTYLLFLSRDKAAVDHFRRQFPKAGNLLEHIRTCRKEDCP